MLDKKVKINFPKATYPPVDGTVIPIKESTERWSDILLEDGTTLRVKPNVLTVVRIDNKFDAEGNPVYGVKSNQVMMVADVPLQLRQGAADTKQSN